ncbi:GNAT family N-acetyltransferase [Pelagibacterium lentulum]|uniref:Ribosomal-protein-alanine N-acetyltransferase n=1 Tax=Pelagibacterium lentulum TaxID=2029865 RepID=A0A916RHK1_9HYPH|nr:GNAT family protein [Pelagibacterium lentulum]GGA56188.1 ribosomal-protein-alanine N-acetyltransferase [Pelagibacterium lentulum]
MFRLAGLAQSGPVIRGDGLLVRCPIRSDFAQWQALRSKSRAFLVPYEPRWSEFELTQKAFASRVRRNRRDAANGAEYSFLIFDDKSRIPKLMGGLTLSNIRRRAAQNVTLGYWMGVDYAGQGIMTRSVALILPFVFDTLGLHRIEAACLPDNLASRRVLIRNGFQEIGLAEHYLQINGAWRDHLLFALTAERYIGFAG